MTGGASPYLIGKIYGYIALAWVRVSVQSKKNGKIIAKGENMTYTVKIEQTFAYPKRMKYIARTDSFIEKDCDSLSYVRNVRQPYGKAIARYVNQRVC